jgi:hypothetical protein
MKNNSSWTLRSNEAMPVSLSFTIVFQGHYGTLNVPTLVGSPYGVFFYSYQLLVFLWLSLSLSDLFPIKYPCSFIFVQFSTHVPSCIIRQCVFASE